jgi:hypothetical protein
VTRPIEVRRCSAHLEDLGHEARPDRFGPLLAVAAVAAGSIAFATSAGAAKKATPLTVLVTNDDWLAKHRAAQAAKPKSAPTTSRARSVPPGWRLGAGSPRWPARREAERDRELQRPELPFRPVSWSAGGGDRATLPRTPVTVDCTATGPKPTTDFDAFKEGYAALSTVPLG